MALINCWQFKNCGREPGGNKAEELGVCPASTEIRANRLNHGVNAGRACWAITGTECGGKAQETFASKLSNCMNKCEFYEKVDQEEGANFLGAKSILSRLK